MAIALRRTVDNQHPEPTATAEQDLADMAKAGDIVAIGDDWMDWSRSIPHGFEIVSLPGVAADYPGLVMSQREMLHKRLNSGILKTNPRLYQRLMNTVERKRLRFLRFSIDPSGNITDKENL